MRKIKFLSTFVLLLAVLVSTGPNIAAQRPLPPQDSGMVYLVSPTELSTAIREMERYGLRVQTFQRQYRMGGQTVVDGYFLTPVDQSQADIPALEGQYWQSYGAMLRDIAQDIARGKPSMIDATAEAAWQSYINDIEEAQEDFSVIEGCWATGTCPRVYVVSTLVSGDAAALREVANSSLVTRVDVRSRVGQETEPTTDTHATAAPAAVLLVPINTWVPKNGDIHVHPSSYPGERYITNWMYWDTATRVSGFGPNSAYEHDFFLNNSSTSKYGPGTYLTAAQSLNGIPSVSYWSSNLPSPYLDTRLSDPDYLKAYTIGCAYADGIAHGVWYSYHIRAANGPAAIDNGCLQAQLAHRSPSSCYTTWCVYMDQIENIYPCSTYLVDPIPGDFYWVK